MLHRSNPTSTPRRARRVAALVTLSGLVVLGGCYQNPDPTGWGAAARRNFIAGCSRDVQAGGGTTTSIAIAERDTCGCIYDKMVKTYNLDWDVMREYEKKQSNAKAGENPPEPPAPLTKAIADCREAGPGL